MSDPRGAPGAAADAPITVLDSRVDYRGRLFSIRVDTLVAGDPDRPFVREVVEHGGAVGIVALDDTGRVVLVRQYRHPVGQYTLEIPAGTLAAGEAPADCARRELHEEAGLTAARWQPLIPFNPTPGYCTETIHLFLATGLAPATESAALDEDEDLSVEWQPLADAVAAAERGEIIDGKTLVALLLAARRLDTAGGGGGRDGAAPT